MPLNTEILPTDGVGISIQKSCVNALKADPYFANEIVLPEYPGDIDTMIEDSLGVRGLSFLVATPAAKCTKRSLPFPFMEYRVVVIAFEQMLIEQTMNLPRAEDALEVAGCILHNFSRAPIHQALTAMDEFYNPIQRANRYGKAINFTVQAGFGRFQTPVLLNDGAGNISIVNLTVGGSTYYTLDGTEPTDLTIALRYSAPFAIGSGVTVKAKSVLAGKFGGTTSTYTRP